MLPHYVRDPLYACYVPNALAGHNAFRSAGPDATPLPTFESARHRLPMPMWEGHSSAIDCYWRAWEIGFGNLGRPTPQNGFVANYIDTAFNGHLFLWDSVFILMFGRYGSRAFDFQRTLDNLYAKQHPDGFICREVDIADGQDCFCRHDPNSTGPNVLAWSEWEYYRNSGDEARLKRVFPVLLAYHQWMRQHRTWPDGSYWHCGWSSGMDNQPRVPHGYSPAHSPAHQSWVDACLQAALSAQLLMRMAERLGRSLDVADLAQERAFLERLLNQRMWDERTAFYYDLRRDGRRSTVKTVGAYWALLAEVVPPERLAAFVSHLRDRRQFCRPHRVPSLSADHPLYKAHGDYWCGGVWPSTNYMVLRGLTQAGCDDLAHEIALNHVQNVVQVYEDTHTLWENYAPETAAPADPARRDFVGWAGLGPIAVLLEYAFGLRPDAAAHRLTWDVRLTEAHGVGGYPFGPEGLLDLRCARRARTTDRPHVEVCSNVPLDVELRWEAGSEVLHIPG